MTYFCWYTVVLYASLYMYKAAWYRVSIIWEQINRTAVNRTIPLSKLSALHWANVWCSPLKLSPSLMSVDVTRLAASHRTDIHHAWKQNYRRTKCRRLVYEDHRSIKYPLAAASVALYYFRCLSSEAIGIFLWDKYKHIKLLDSLLVVSMWQTRIFQTTYRLILAHFL